MATFPPEGILKFRLQKAVKRWLKAKLTMIHNEISDYELFLNKKHLDILKSLSKKEITSNNERLILNLLDKLFIYFVFSKYQDCFDIIHRITINKKILKTNKRLKDIGNLKYPPDCNLVTTYGRCNLPNQSVLYASFMEITSLGELRPKIGDLITQSTWKLKVDVPLTYVPIFSKQPTNEPFINTMTGETIEGLSNLRTLDLERRFKEVCEDLPKNLKELCYCVVEFIAEFFAKKVNSGNHLNYIFSAYFSNKFLNVIEGGSIDAIVYPSVPDKLNSENLAIKPQIFDQLYRLAEVRECIIIQDLSDGRGGYGMEATSTCKDFNYDTNEILWDYEKNNDFSDFIRLLINKYNIDLS